MSKLLVDYETGRVLLAGDTVEVSLQFLHSHPFIATMGGSTYFAGPDAALASIVRHFEQPDTGLDAVEYEVQQRVDNRVVLQKIEEN